MILHDAATLFVTLIDRAVLTVQLLAFVACVAVLAAAPLIAPRARRAAQTARTAPHSPSRVSRATEPAPRPVQRRTARPVPSWAHTEPYDYDEAA